MAEPATMAHMDCPIVDCPGAVDVEIGTSIPDDQPDTGMVVNVKCKTWRTVGDDHTHEYAEGEFDR